MPTSDDQVRGDEPLLPRADAETDADAEGAVEVVANEGHSAFVDFVSIQGEMIDFVHRRWQDVLETAGSLLSCRGDASQAFALQAGFACRATEQYLEQTGKLMAMTQALARCWWSPMVLAVGDARDLAAEA